MVARMPRFFTHQLELVYDELIFVLGRGPHLDRPQVHLRLGVKIAGIAKSRWVRTFQPGQEGVDVLLQSRDGLVARWGRSR